MSRRNSLLEVIGRLLAALAAGLVVAGAAYLFTYFDQRGVSDNRYRELHTQSQLNDLQSAIEWHLRSKGQLPTNLAELDGVRWFHHFPVDAAGRVVDSWGRPYEYRVEGESFELYSLGSDGQPGGVGRDADLYPGSEGRPPELLTLRQFTFDLPTKSVQRTCMLAGVSTALICLVVTRNRCGTRCLGRASATMVVCFLVAIAISSLQMSSGH